VSELRARRSRRSPGGAPRWRSPTRGRSRPRPAVGSPAAHLLRCGGYGRTPLCSS